MDTVDTKSFTSCELMSLSLSLSAEFLYRVVRRAQEASVRWIDTVDTTNFFSSNFALLVLIVLIVV